MKATLFAGKYNITDNIGEGGMCQVHRARQLLFDRIIALKILKPILARSDDCRRRFLREARNNAVLDHHNIITIYEVNEHDGRPYIAMQYAGGGSLKDLMETGCKPARAIDIMSDVLEAVACAHEHDMLHRDLKPENILLTEEGQVKVGDWGLSKALDGAQNVTSAGVVLGTPEYMSPEQITSLPLERSSDLYSIGVMLFELISGTLPFACETVTDLLQAHLHSEPMSIRQIVPAVPTQLAELIHALLAKDPSKRPSSALSVAQELDSLKHLVDRSFETYESTAVTCGVRRITRGKDEPVVEKRRTTAPTPAVKTAAIRTRYRVIVALMYLMVILVILGVLFR